MADSREHITDDMILSAMIAPGEPEHVARNVVLLFARRVGQRMTEDEIEASAAVILKTMKLPVKHGEL